MGETSATLGPTAAERPDGRTTRSARTREAIVDALLSLNDRGQLQPSARDIASEAGVALRTLYVHFDDVEALILAAADRQRRRMDDLLPPIVADGPFGTRLDAFLTRRATMHETGAEVRRAAQLREPTSPAMQGVLRRSRKLLRAEIAHCFAPEIEASGELGPRLLAGLDVAASSNTWETLRAHQGLDVDAAAGQVRAMVITWFRAWAPAEVLGPLPLDPGGRS